LNSGHVVVVVVPQSVEGHRDRVDVHIQDAGVCVLGRDVVNLVDAGDAAAEIDELPDPGVETEPYGAMQERPMGSGNARQVRYRSDESSGQLRVGTEVVRSAKQVVMDPGQVGLARVDRILGPPGTDHRATPAGWAGRPAVLWRAAPGGTPAEALMPGVTKVHG